MIFSHPCERFVLPCKRVMTLRFSITLKNYKIYFSALLRLWHFPLQKTFFIFTKLHSPVLLFLPTFLCSLCPLTLVLCWSLLWELSEFPYHLKAVIAHVLSKEASQTYTVHDALPILFLLFLCKVMHSRTFSCITASKVILRSCNNSQGQDMENWKSMQEEFSVLWNGQQTMSSLRDHRNVQGQRHFSQLQRKLMTIHSEIGTT